jgi:cytoskeletal protein CcmA (bactofilin family)
VIQKRFLRLISLVFRAKMSLPTIRIGRDVLLPGGALTLLRVKQVTAGRQKEGSTRTSSGEKRRIVSFKQEPAQPNPMKTNPSLKFFQPTLAVRSLSKLRMQHFSHLFPRREDTNPPQTVATYPSVVTGPSNHRFMPTQSDALLSRGVSIKGSVKFLNGLFIDGEVEGTIDSSGTLRIGEHGCIRGDIRTKSVKARGTVEGNIFATERCELQAGCTLHGDIEAPRLVVDQDVTFCGIAKVGTWKSLSA